MNVNVFLQVPVTLVKLFLPKTNTVLANIFKSSLFLTKFQYLKIPWGNLTDNACPKCVHEQFA